MRRSYIDGPYGQVHIRQWGNDLSKPPLLCLSPSPSSGKSYFTLAPLLATHRRVVAIDYPGYGNSDPCPNDPSIGDFADAVGAVINTTFANEAVDLLGFHTGCLVAVETSLRFPQAVNRLVLVDVPYFEPARQAEFLKTYEQPVVLEPELSMLAKTWDFCVANKLELIPIQRAYDMFVDYISSGETANLAFKAAFSYPCEERFSKVSHATLVIATSAGLYEPTCLTAKTISSASLVEHKNIEVAVLEKGAPIIAETSHQFLS